MERGRGKGRGGFSRGNRGGQNKQKGRGGRGQEEQSSGHQPQQSGMKRPAQEATPAEGMHKKKRRKNKQQKGGGATPLLATSQGVASSSTSVEHAVPFGATAGGEMDDDFVDDPALHDEVEGLDDEEGDLLEEAEAGVVDAMEYPDSEGERGLMVEAEGDVEEEGETQAGMALNDGESSSVKRVDDEGKVVGSGEERQETRTVDHPISGKDYKTSTEHANAVSMPLPLSTPAPSALPPIPSTADPSTVSHEISLPSLPTLSLNKSDSNPKSASPVPPASVVAVVPASPLVWGSSFGVLSSPRSITPSPSGVDTGYGYSNLTNVTPLNSWYLSHGAPNFNVTMTPLRESTSPGDARTRPRHIVDSPPRPSPMSAGKGHAVNNSSALTMSGSSISGVNSDTGVKPVKLKDDNGEWLPEYLVDWHEEEEKEDAATAEVVKGGGLLAELITGIKEQKKKNEQFRAVLRTILYKGYQS